MNNEIPKKVRDFVSSKEFDSWVEDFGKFLGIAWEDVRMPKVINFLIEWLTTDEFLKDLIKKNLNFLDEEKIDSFNDFLNKNYFDKVKELKTEETPEEQKETEETFEEREKRYVELMKEILNLPQREEKKEEISTEEKKIITFEPKKIEARPVEQVEIKKIAWEKKEQEEPELPEGTIILKKKEEEKPVKKEEDFLDLSNL